MAAVERTVMASLAKTTDSHSKIPNTHSVRTSDQYVYGMLQKDVCTIPDIIAKDHWKKSKDTCCTYHLYEP